MLKFSLLTVLLVTGLIACSEEKSDEERIKKVIDSTSVHLMLGLKIIAVNPNSDPEIIETQRALEQILVAPTTNKDQQGLSLAEAAQLAQIAYQAKRLGAAEVELGRSSEFNFMNAITTKNKNEDQEPIPLTHEHAMTLVALNAIKLHPTLPLPITQEQLLYEAWMAKDATFNDDYMDVLVKVSQVSAFANNDFCDLARDKSNWFTQGNLKEVNKSTVMGSVAGIAALGRAAAHAPEAVAIIIPILLAPAILELLPNALRLKAHIDTAQCFDERGDQVLALEQKKYAVDTLEAMGVPETELAMYRTSIAYQSGDLDAAGEYLKIAANSQLIDTRTQSDLTLLANNLNTPDDKLVAKYLSKLDLSLTLVKIINQRLIDEGIYQQLENSLDLKRLESVLSGLNKTNSDELIDKGNSLLESGKGLLDKVKSS